MSQYVAVQRPFQSLEKSMPDFWTVILPLVQFWCRITCGSKETTLNDFGVNIDSYTATLLILVVQSFRTISPADRRSLERVEALS